ncbi:retrovirus-related pol polyprotein from transposon TNT 1-94 [Tanacetum coccineum]|uniref:Retrovirus-related pol polyprotein from transposon TNT 1-94 n=1 Tax=Tanacetum coccineum TaxID=301880 RepID=A0ABQ5GAL2_9ASTR
MSPSIPDPYPKKKVDSFTVQLLLTLMEEVKGIKEQMKPLSDNSASVSQIGSSKSSKDKQKTRYGPCKHCGNRNHLPKDEYIKPKCSTCGSFDHLTKEHPKQAFVKNTLAKLKAQSSQGSSLRKAYMITKYFIDCKYCGFNNHHSNGYEYYPGCDICGSIAHETTNCAKKPSLNNRKPRIANPRSTEPTEKYSESGPKVVFGDNSSGNTEGYGSVNCNGITFTRVAYGTIFNKNNEVMLIAPRRRDVYVIDKTSYNEESNACFFSKASNTCEKRKHHRASFKTKRSFSISKCLHLLHMDLFGPVKPQTISHNKYTLVIVDEYSRTIIIKIHGKTTYDVFRGRSPDISYFYMFDYLVHIHNHKDHLGKFDEKDDDGFFLGYSLVAKYFRVFNIRRQQMEETYHVTFSEDDEAITKSSTKGDEINFNKNISFLDDEFLVPRSNVSSSLGKDDYFPYVPAYDPLSTNNITISDHVTPTNTPTLQDISSPNESAQF